MSVLGSARRRFQTWRQAKSLILMYHRIDAPPCDPWGLCVTPQSFAQQMEVLARRGVASSLADIVGNTGKVAVTFDDGYADNLYQAGPVLKRLQIPATVFVVTGAVGESAFWWDELEQILLHSPLLPERPLSLEIEGRPRTWQLAPADLRVSHYKDWIAWRDPAPTTRQAMFRDAWEALRGVEAAKRRQHLEQIRGWSEVPLEATEFRPMTTGELRELSADGLVEPGAHTVTHTRLSALSPQEQRNEIEGSKAWLTDAIGKPVASFSFPFGGASDYTPATLEAVRHAGFSRACTTAGYAVRSKSDRFQLPRVHAPNLPGEEFSRWLDTQLASC